MAHGSSSWLHRLGFRAAAAAVVLGASAGALFWGARALLPAEGEVAHGLRVDGIEATDGETPGSLAHTRARALLERRLELRYGTERAAEVTPEELGATVDIPEITRRIAEVAHGEDLFDRVDDALEARRGQLDIPVRIALPIEGLAARLERFKEENDTLPRAAKLDVATRQATPHHAGRSLDVYAAAAAIMRAIAANERVVEIPAYALEPRASSDVVARIDTTQVLSKFETRFGYLGGQAGRAQNIQRAASQMNGVVLMPGEIVSFNANVGPRSVENGFATAPEIFKGEMRDGIGGGTCQVSGTLHAAAFFGGVDIVERINHSRPSGYIKVGLDATVVYPVVDLKLKNPFDFPIVVHATISKGTLVFELLGRERPATVDLSTDTIGVSAYKRKVEDAPWLAAGEVRLKQKGIRGLSIRKTRVIKYTGGKERVEVSNDVYPPTFEIYLVPPGTDVETALPPLPGAVEEDRLAAPASSNLTAAVTPPPASGAAVPAVH